MPTDNISTDELRLSGIAEARNNDRRRDVRAALGTLSLDFPLVKFNRWGASLHRTLLIVPTSGQEAFVFNKGDHGKKSFRLIDISVLSRCSKNPTILTVHFKSKSNRAYKLQFGTEREACLCIYVLIYYV